MSTVSDKHKIVMMARITVPADSVWHLDPVIMCARLEELLGEVLDRVVTGEADVVVSITEATGNYKVQPKVIEFPATNIQPSTLNTQLPTIN